MSTETSETNAALYNEALQHAHDGQLAKAQACLTMLTSMNPKDTDALLLLARVHCAQERFGEALMLLDRISAAGGTVSQEFREAVMAAIQKQKDQHNELQQGLAAVQEQIEEHHRRTQSWKWATIATTCVSTLVIVCMILMDPRAELQATITKLKTQNAELDSAFQQSKQRVADLEAEVQRRDVELASVTTRLDPDGDRVLYPDDVCPQSPGEEEGALEAETSRYRGCRANEVAWYGTLPPFQPEVYVAGKQVEIAIPDGRRFTCVITANAEDTDFGSIDKCSY